MPLTAVPPSLPASPEAPLEQMSAAVWIALGTITKWAKNPRKNDRAVPRVARSIRKYGFVAPVVVWESRRRLVAGHTRIAALESILAAEPGFVPRDAPGVGLVPVRMHEFTDETEANAYAIADNKLAELAEWDDEGLTAILADMKATDAAILAETGFDERELAKLLGDGGAGASGTDPGAGEPPEVPVSKLGEIYQLGPHRLMCGDSTKPEDVQRLMAGERAVMMATDPPYLVDYTGEDHPQSAKRKAAFVEAGKPAEQAGNKNWDEYKDPTTSVEFFSAFIRVALAEALIENPAIYQWHASRRQALVEAAWTANGLLWHQQIIWVKARPILTHSWFMWRHEPCAAGWIEGKPPSLRPPVSGDNSTVWTIDQKGEHAEGHPTIKPLEIFTRPLSYHTAAGDLCFEPFSGSGTQIIAAAKLGRRCYAMELAPSFVDVARRRWTGYARSAGIDPGPGALE